jgi:hypothetical protein
LQRAIIRAIPTAGMHHAPAHQIDNWNDQHTRGP